MGGKCKMGLQTGLKLEGRNGKTAILRESEGCCEQKVGKANVFLVHSSEKEKNRAATGGVEHSPTGGNYPEWGNKERAKGFCSEELRSGGKGNY